MGAATGALLALGVTAALWVVPVQMPPPPGRSTGYALQIAFDGGLYGLTLLAMLALAGMASAWIAQRTVRRPIVEALAHV